MKWMKCSERLPEVNDRIELLAWSGEYYWVALHEKYGGFYCSINGLLIDGVTHWMPLPDPPEEE